MVYQLRSFHDKLIDYLTDDNSYSVIKALDGNCNMILSNGRSVLVESIMRHSYITIGNLLDDPTINLSLISNGVGSYMPLHYAIENGHIPILAKFITKLQIYDLLAPCPFMTGGLSIFEGVIQFTIPDDCLYWIVKNVNIKNVNIRKLLETCVSNIACCNAINMLRSMNCIKYSPEFRRFIKRCVRLGLTQLAYLIPLCDTPISIANIIAIDTVHIHGDETMFDKMIPKEYMHSLNWGDIIAHACTTLNISIVSHIIKSNYHTDLTIKNTSGYTTFQLVVDRTDNLNMLKYIVESTRQMYRDTKIIQICTENLHSSGNTLLHMAIKKNRQEISMYLITNCRQLCAIDNFDGFFPFEFLSCNYGSAYAEMVIEYTHDVAPWYIGLDLKLLWNLCIFSMSYGTGMICSELCSKNPVLIETSDDVINRTMFHYACKSKCIKLLHKLVSLNALICPPDIESVNGNLKVLNVIYTYACDNLGTDIVHCHMKRNYDKLLNSVFIYASTPTSDVEKRVLEWLFDNGAGRVTMFYKNHDHGVAFLIRLLYIMDYPFFKYIIGMLSSSDLEYAIVNFKSPDGNISHHIGCFGTLTWWNSLDYYKIMIEICKSVPKHHPCLFDGTGIHLLIYIMKTHDIPCHIIRDISYWDDVKLSCDILIILSNTDILDLCEFYHSNDNIELACMLLNCIRQSDGALTRNKDVTDELSGLVNTIVPRTATFMAIEKMILSKNLMPCLICSHDILIATTNILSGICKHDSDFHSDCIKRWVIGDERCPVCRATVFV